MTKSLSDSVYAKEIARMSDLPGFPHLPAAQLPLRRALRRITETDKGFLHQFISDVIDTAPECPTPAQLIFLAAAKRRARARAGDPNCPKCGGSGFVEFTRRVQVPGMQPYDGEFSALCSCRGGRAIGILEKGAE